MPRDYTVYLNDIIDAIARIEEYTTGSSLETFKADRKTTDAVIRNLEVIEEATKNVPQEIRGLRSDIDWRKIAGLRDILAHQYFGVDLDIV
jgi:uncharacterized protein with HEPN domain